MNLFDIRKKMLLSIINAFPAEPTAYTLIEKYTATQTWTAPEDGYFQIEVFGASGKGGKSYYEIVLDMYHYYASGGGGGGGAYACSRIKLKSGDTVVISGSVAVGGTVQVTINSSVESYSVMEAVGGGNGGDGSNSLTSQKAGTGGTAGTASGGNYSNADGGKGGNGKVVTRGINNNSVTGGTGGTAGYTGGNAGGKGGSGSMNSDEGSFSGSAGSKAFINIYRGDTNVVA